VLSGAETEKQILRHSCYDTTKQILCYQTQGAGRGKRRKSYITCCQL